jgi:hypothetical protein
MAARNVQVTLRYCNEVSAADWIVQAPIPWTQLVGFGPQDFPVYARLRFIPDPTEPGQVESDVNLSDDHPSDLEQTQRALGYLRPFTATPEECYFCAWEGYAEVHFDGPMVTIPHRRYLLVQGSLIDFASWGESLDGLGSGQPPAFAWPADHTWCFASDVDPHWAGIGADQAAIDALLNAPDVDVVRAGPAEPHPSYY